MTRRLVTLDQALAEETARFGGGILDDAPLLEEPPDLPPPPGEPAAARPLGERPEPAEPVRVRATPFAWREPSDIPPREWLYGRHYVRKFLSATIAPGGVGKSSLALVEAVSMAIGRDLLRNGRKIEKRRVWVFNGEDPMDELERRLAAIIKRHEVDPSEIGGRLFIDSGRSTKIIIAEQLRSGVSVNRPMVEALTTELRAREIDVMIVDPFVSSHRVSENDNVAIDAVARTWANIADAANCAVELIHHARKTGGAEVTIDDARGASAMRDAARSVRILNKMTEDEQARAAVESRHEFFRVDFGKANMSRPSDKSDWFRTVTEFLGNARERLVQDEVGVVVSWAWPNALDGVSKGDVRKVQDRIAAGEWAESVQAANWAGRAIGEVLDIDSDDKAGKARVLELLRTWIKGGVLRVELRRNQQKGRDQKMIVVGVPQ